MSNKFLGVKIVLAIAMTREAFEALHGRNVGGDIHGEGYEVEYENGYKAWSPKEVFDAAYAIAMTREAFEVLHGRNVGGDIHGEGYEVEHENGYKAWSPKEVFDAAYRHASGLTFGLAIEALKLGKKVARAGWNGKGMWLRLVLSIHDIPKSGTSLPVYRLTCEDDATALPWIGMKTADNKFVPWLASQTDVLAEDWEIVA